jgi:hypothetical protein
MTPLFNKPMSRRTVLRGLGAAVALPWLEAMVPRSILASSDTGTLPIRLGFIYVPNGADMAGWTPNALGANFAMPPVLRPLTAVRDDILVISGLAADKARPHGDGGNHAPARAAYLTGTHPRKTQGSDIRNGVSVDQVAAAQNGHLTRFPSLEIGCRPIAWGCDTGFACVYTSTMSWRSPTQPVPKVESPRLVFDRLFAVSAGPNEDRRLSARRSILDTVRQETTGLHQLLGNADRRKLDEYLTAVREIEQRIGRTQPLRLPDGAARPDAGVPANYEEQLRLLGDLMVLAYQTDTTRIATFLFDHEQSQRSYRELGISGGHHSVSHHGNNPETKEKIAVINRFHLTQFAYILGKLKDIREGDGTLLDRCLIAYGSTIADGNTHAHHDLPILLAGKGGGSIQSGRHIQFPAETPLTNLWLSMLDRVGVRTPSLGDSTGQLRGLEG